MRPLPTEPVPADWWEPSPQVILPDDEGYDVEEETENAQEIRLLLEEQDLSTVKQLS